MCPPPTKRAFGNQPVSRRHPTGWLVTGAPTQRARGLPARLRPATRGARRWPGPTARPAAGGRRAGTRGTARGGCCVPSNGRRALRRAARSRWAGVGACCVPLGCGRARCAPLPGGSGARWRARRRAPPGCWRARVRPWQHAWPWARPWPPTTCAWPRWRPWPAAPWWPVPAGCRPATAPAWRAA